MSQSPGIRNFPVASITCEFFGNSIFVRVWPPAFSHFSVAISSSLISPISSLKIQLGASSRSRGYLMLLSRREPLSDGLPVNVREECLEIHRAVRGFVIEQESMLPDVQNEHWIKPRDVADLMECDPMVRDALLHRVLIANCQAHPALS